MFQLETEISNLVSEQMPAFYQEHGPNFVNFVKTYYEWMEQPGNVMAETRSLPEYLDIDSTIDDFVEYFKAQYLANIPAGSKEDTAFSIKHIQDLYKNKGTTEADKLLFRLIFDTEADVYVPGDDILRASDGVWKRPRYIEVEYSDSNYDLVGFRITGGTSGATGIVESVARRTVDGRIIDIIYLTDIVGSFGVNEYITKDGSFANASKIIGSLSSVSIVDGSTGVSNGDVFSISGISGVGGSARVVSTINGSGKVQFTLVSGGYGYNLSNTIVTISNAVYFHSGNTFNTNTSITNYSEDETVTQNAYSMTFTTGSVPPIGYVVEAYNSSNTLLGNAIITSINASTISMTSNFGTLTTAARLVSTAVPTLNVTISSANLSSKTAKVLQTNSTAVGFVNVSSDFLLGGYMRGGTSNTFSLVTRLSSGNGASFAIDTISNTEVANVGGTNMSLGSILSISSINPGSNYDTPPMIRVRCPAVANTHRYDHSLTLANVSGVFLEGQTFLGNTIPGVVKSFSNNNLKVYRTLYAGNVASNTIVYSYYGDGTISGTGRVTAVAEDTSAPEMGNNAVVSSRATSLPGVVSEVEIIDSGVGHRQDELLTFVSESNSDIIFTGTANIIEQGKQVGFWKNNRGKLNSDKYLQDNDYYQVYSYEIQTDLSIDHYADVMKKLFHTAGTRMFSRYVQNSNKEVTVGSNGASITLS